MKIFEDLCNRLDTIPACDRRTDILPQHSLCYAYASHGKNRYLKCRYDTDISTSAIYRRYVRYIDPPLIGYWIWEFTGWYWQECFMWLCSIKYDDVGFYATLMLHLNSSQSEVLWAFVILFAYLLFLSSEKVNFLDHTVGHREKHLACNNPTAEVS